MSEFKDYPSIQLGSPGEDISKKDLHAINIRFKNLNQLRLKRIQEFLQPRQRVFLQLLPLLFHQNHPLLPGFISSDTVVGIPDYKPNKQTTDAAKKYSKGFLYKRRALPSYYIHGIFLMGSVSSIAFSKSSDMDIWLCYKPGLLSSKIEELQQKATEIENWAATLKLEVHFFLIDNQQFCQGQHDPISVESSGKTQHFILLEEFYRTAIFIAGRIPAWWLVPPNQEQNYTLYLNHLLENRFIAENDVIDFGGLESIPVEEFISATLWHIYKSISSPHKSLLKLFLMESYAQEYPQPQWLCFELKKSIYQGSFNIDRLDPYFLIYSKVEDNLQNPESIQRLNLARQCFFLKIMGSSTTRLDYQTRVFREDYLQSIADLWNWPENLLPELIEHKYWDIKKAIQEHIIIRSELKRCLRMALSLAAEHVNYHYRTNNDLKLISRKLHVFLDKKPGKIEIITTRSNVQSKENELTIIESMRKNATSVWTLYSGKYTNQQLSIKQESSLLGLLGWLIINGLYKKSCQFHFQPETLRLSKNELQQILAQLFEFLSTNLATDTASLSIYNNTDKLLATLLFINLGLPELDERGDGLLLMSERSDPLSYGNNRQNFIKQIDQISVSNWGEVSITQFIGTDALFDCLTAAFNNSLQPICRDKFQVVCFTPIRAKSITLRIETIFENLIEFFAKQADSSSYRYFLPCENSYTVFQKKNARLHYWPLESNELVLQELSNTQDSFSEVFFDPYVAENSLIPFLYTRNQKQKIQVFYLNEKNIISIYIIDEKGSLFIQEHKQSNYNQVLSHYSLFLESILLHPFYSSELRLEFYEIRRNAEGIFNLHPATWTTSLNFTDLRINIENSSTKKSAENYYIYCNEIEFSSLQYDTKLFEKVSQAILKSRNNKEIYPIHISDIDAPSSYLGIENDSQRQAIHYLKLKKKIEDKLNAFL